MYLLHTTYVKETVKVSLPESNRDPPTRCHHSSTAFIHNRFPRKARRHENKTFRHSSQRLIPHARARPLYFTRSFLNRMDRE